MKRFQEYSNLTLDELYQVHLKALQSADPRDKHQVSRLVKACMTNMEEDYSSSTAYAVYKAVKSFLDSQGLDFKLHGSKPRLTYQGQRIIEKKEIESLLDATGSQRNKAMIYTLKDSGLRVSDLVKLNYGHVKDALESGNDFQLIRLRQKKNDMLAQPILGPESLGKIRMWIEHRQKQGEHVGNDSPIFTQVEGKKKGRPLSSSSVSTTIKKLVDKCGLHDVSAHSFRKYHTTMLQAGGVPETWITLIQGRKIMDSRSAYVQPSDSQLIQAYSDAYSSLAIDEVSNFDRVEDLEKEVAQLRQDLAKYERLEKIFDDPGQWARDKGIVPPKGFNDQQYGEWMGRKYPDNGSITFSFPNEKSNLVDEDGNIAYLNPENASSAEELTQQIKQIVQQVLTTQNQTQYTYQTIDTTDELNLIKLLEEGWDIYREINGKIIMRK